jgi:hypothetical protein
MDSKPQFKFADTINQCPGPQFAFVIQQQKTSSAAKESN